MIFPLRDDEPREARPVITIALIAINTLIFLYELSLGPEELFEFIRQYGLVPRRLTDPGWAAEAAFTDRGYGTVFTSMFLHAGFLHLLGNMWMLWIFGDNVEDRMGRIRFPIFYVACGGVAALVQYLAGVNSEIPTVGASGAVAGVMGAYFCLFPHARVHSMVFLFIIVFFVSIPAYFFLGLWVLMEFLSGTLTLGRGENVGGIAFWAHVGGFVTGVVLHRFLVRRGPPRPEILPPRRPPPGAGRPPFSSGPPPEWPPPWRTRR